MLSQRFCFAGKGLLAVALVFPGSAFDPLCQFHTSLLIGRIGAIVGALSLVIPI